MKKTIAIFITVILIMSLVVGCKKDNTSTTETTKADTTTNSGTTTKVDATTTADSGLNPIINMESLYPITTEMVNPSVVFKSVLTLTEPKDTYLFNVLRDKFNLDFKTIGIIPEAWGERFSLMANTGDLPDVIFNGQISNADLQRYFAEGELGYDMTEDIAKYAPDIALAFEKIPTMKAASTFEGKILSLPAYIGAYGSPSQRDWVRSDWLQTLGIDKPTTLSEFKEMLIAFRDMDPNGNNIKDEIPWGGSWSEGFSEREMIISAFGYVGGNSNNTLNYNGETPVFSYFPLSDSYYDYLVFMKGLWDEGLMDLDMFTQTEIQSLAKVSENIVGVVAGGAQYTLLPDDKPENYTDYIYQSMIPMSASAGGKGYYKLAQEFASGYFTISADSEYADILVRFANVAFAWPTLGALGYSGAAYDSEFDIMENHRGAAIFDPDAVSYTFPDKVENFPDMSNWDYMQNYVGATIIQWAFTRLTIPDYLKEKLPDNSPPLYKHVTGPIDKNPKSWQYELTPIMYKYGVATLPELALSRQGYERIAELATPLSDYVSTMEVKIIIGAEPLSVYEKMIENLKSMGAEEYQKIYFDAYEDYKAALN